MLRIGRQLLCASYGRNKQQKKQGQEESGLFVLHAGGVLNQEKNSCQPTTKKLASSDQVAIVSAPNMVLTDSSDDTSVLAPTQREYNGMPILHNRGCTQRHQTLHYCKYLSTVIFVCSVSAVNKVIFKSRIPNEHMKHMNLVRPV